MANDTSTPVLVFGKLPKECYSSLQEFCEDFAANLRIPQNTQEVIKGAEGKKGPKGDKGEKGEKGDKGDGSTNTLQKIAIPLHATYVDFPFFEQWEKASYKIVFEGYVSGGSPSNDPESGPGTGIVSIGAIYKLFATPVTTLRMYFTFFNCDTVPVENHSLYICDVR